MVTPKLALDYAEEGGRRTRRTVWPFLVGYRDATRVLFAWCELRTDFRMFRLDRVATAEFHDERYPDRPPALKARWLKSRPAYRPPAEPSPPLAVLR